MNDLETKLKEYFADKENVLMAFLFGSAAKGRQIAESDVDVAVWLREPYTMDDHFKINCAISTISRKEVDLILLNSARPTVSWAAMRGKKLLIRDINLYFKTLLNISMEAEDMQDFTLDLFAMREKHRLEAKV